MGSVQLGETVGRVFFERDFPVARVRNGQEGMKKGSIIENYDP